MERGRATTSDRWWMLAPLLAVIVFTVPVPARIVEDVYSRGIYPQLQAELTSATNVLPFSALDALIGLVLVATLYRLARLATVARRAGIVDAVAEGARRTLRAAAVMALAFMATWGCNYRRLPLVVDVPSADRTAASLRDVIETVAAFAGHLRTRPDFDVEVSWDQAASLLERPMDEALKILGRDPLVSPGRPKFSRVLAPLHPATGVSGLINPFGLESIVQDDLLPVERGFVLSRAWAHLAGFADDAEASAVGWLACMKGDPALAYSASLDLILQAARTLPAADYAEVRAELHPAVRADIDQIVRRTLDQQSPAAHEATMRLYAGYLRANHASDVDNDNRALALILSPTFHEALYLYVLPDRVAGTRSLNPQASGQIRTLTP